MRAFANLKHRTLVVTMAGLGLIAIGFVSIAARGQEASRKSADSRDGATNARTAKFQADMQQRLVNEESCALTLAKLTKDAVGNVSFCATTFLGDRSETDLENYRMCVSLASELLTRQINKCESANVIDITDAVYLVAVWANVQLRVASTTGDGGVAGVNQQAAFKECVDDYKANVVTCNESFPVGSPGLELCLDHANDAWTGCVSRIN